METLTDIHRKNDTIFVHRYAASTKFGTLYTLSVNSNMSMREAYMAAMVNKQDPLQWFQLYVESDRESSERLVRQCEKIGYKALVVTVDRPRLGRRLADLRNNFILPPHLKRGNLEGGGADAYFGGSIDASLKWEDLKWLKSITKLPIVLKGIMTAEDAVLAVKHGVAGIIVSNHGGRQLDSCPATVSYSSTAVLRLNF